MNYESKLQYFGSSKTGDDASKKPREGTSGSYTDEADIFEEDVESADCQKVLFNCLKNLEQKNNNLYMLANRMELANSNKEMQIKGNKELIDLRILTGKKHPKIKL